MTVTNGTTSPRKTPASQLDRLDGLSEALRDSVSDAVKGVVGDVVRETVKETISSTITELLGNLDLLKAIPKLLNQAQPTLKSALG